MTTRISHELGGDRPAGVEGAGWFALALFCGYTGMSCHCRQRGACRYPYMRLQAPATIYAPPTHADPTRKRLAQLGSRMRFRSRMMDGGW